MTMNISSVHLGLTDNCNFRCDYCFSGRQQPANLSLDMGKKAIDFIASQATGPVCITYFGGEPLLRFPLLRDITAYASRKKTGAVSFTFDLVTNGSLLTEVMIDFLVRHRFSVLFSFDGIKDAQDAHRRRSNGSSTHRNVLRNLHRLLESNLPIAVRPTITPKNVAHLSQSVAFLFDLGVKQIAFDLAYESGWTNPDMRILKNQMEKVAALYLKKILPDREDIIIYAFHEALIARMTGESRPRCGGGKESFYVAPNGDLLFCCWFRGAEKKERIAKIGNLQTGFDAKKLETINCAVDTSVKKKFGCTDCGYQNMCNKYCIAHNFLCTGDPFTAAPSVCAYEKIRIATALKLGKKLFDRQHPYVINILRDLLFT